MKNLSKLSIALISLAVVGAGCSSSQAVKTTDQQPAGAQQPAAAAQSGADLASAKLTAAGIAFTMKDKTQSGQASFGAVADAIAAITEFKITGTGVIVSIVDAKDGRAGIVMAKMGEQFINVVKTADANYNNLFVFDFGDSSKHSAEIIFKAEDQSTATKVETALSVK